ncbi:XrtB/PEP-CTERM-associated polysaccharide biosynthesis outer membrane protein EpsL [Massilia sp. W12]|uniref:XrtB/PEP-CTERM-associated polysaccharide biosynthesis outer membrane protein EpsL n=1 Tax=Massilia sp. W12 TaxID=3126507 RepID=UPI0030CEF627
MAPAVPSRLCRRLCGLLLLTAAASAHAESGKLITPFADLSYNYASNLRSRPDVENPNVSEQERQARDKQARQDWELNTRLGLALEKKFGRQLLQGRFVLGHSKFQNHTDLNYDSREGQTTLAWQLGNHIAGNLGVSNSKTMSPFDVYEGRVLVSLRNLRQQNNRFVDGGWRFHPSFRLRGTLGRLDLSNELDTVKMFDRKQITREAWLDWLPASGSSLSLMVRRTGEGFPLFKDSERSADKFDRSTDEIKLKLHWAYSAKTELQLLTGYVRRKYQFQPERDYSGLNWHLNGNWRASAKLEFGAQLWRALDGVDKESTSLSLSNGLRIIPVWNISSKLRLDGRLNLERRTAVPMPGMNVNLVEKVYNATLGLTWVPLPKLQVSANVGRDQLDSNLEYRSYHNNRIGLNAHYEY